MEENLHKDNLESLFKKEFDGLPDDPAPDGWDTPSEQVWENIVAVPPGSNGLLAFSWNKLILGLLLLSLAGATFFLWHQNSRLSQEVRLQAAEIEALNQDLQEQQQTNEGASAISENSTTIEKETGHEIAENALEQNSKEPITVNTFNENALTDLPVTDMAKTEINESVTLGTPSTLSKSDTDDEIGIAGNLTPEAVKAESLPESSADVLSINEVGFLPVPINSLEMPGPVPHLVPVAFPGKIEPVNNTSFYAGAYIAPSFTTNRITTTHGPLLFRSMEKESWSNERGMKAGVLINGKWKVSTGAGFYNAAMTSRQVFRINYDQTLETQVGSEYQSTYALSVPSSYGSTDVEVDFRRSSSDQLMQGQHVLLDVITRQRLKFVNIPLMIGFEKGKGRLTYGIQTGMALNILKTTSFEAEIKSKSPKFRRHNGPRVTRQLTETKKVGYDYLLSAGIGFELTPSIRISLEPVLRTNITPVVSTTDFSNKLNSFSLHAGAYYQF